jgi:hypothetical protein
MNSLDRVHDALDRSRTPSWAWERLALLAVEIPACAVAVVLAPTAAGLVAAGASLLGALTAQAQRSISARRAEQASRRGQAGHALTCERDAARWATASAIGAGAAPALVIATALLGAGVTAAVAYAAALSAARWAWALGYARWRRSRVAWRQAATAPLRPDEQWLLDEFLEKWTRR